MHELEPAAVDTELPEHTVHTAEPVEFENVPAGQSGQKYDAWNEKEPTGHGEHSAEAGAAANVPATQIEHATEPGFGAEYPAGHAAQLVGVPVS